MNSFIIRQTLLHMQLWKKYSDTLLKLKYQYYLKVKICI